MLTDGIHDDLATMLYCVAAVTAKVGTVENTKARCLSRGAAAALRNFPTVSRSGNKQQQQQPETAPRGSFKFLRARFLPFPLPVPPLCMYGITPLRLSAQNMICDVLIG